MARALGTLPTGGLLLATISACAGPQIYGLRHDRSFTYQSLDSGSIAVGCVTAVGRESVPDSITRGQFESLLTNSLRDGYRGLEVRSAGAVAAEFGDSLHGEVLNRYRRAGELDSATLHDMSARLAKPRYVVFARIESDVIDSAETVTQDSADKKLNVEQVVRLRFRTMTVGFHVYDLSLSRAVWSGELVKADTASSTYSQPRKLVASVVTAIIRGSPKYPTAPSQNKVLRLLFDDFAESLPQAPKPRSR